MTASDAIAFSKIMTSLGVIFNKEITKEFIQLYFQLLENFDIILVSDSVKSHLKNRDVGVFFPKPAQLIAYCEDEERLKEREKRVELENMIEKNKEFLRHLVYEQLNLVCENPDNCTPEAIQFFETQGGIEETKIKLLFTEKFKHDEVEMDMRVNYLRIQNDFYKFFIEHYYQEGEMKRVLTNDWISSEQTVIRYEESRKRLTHKVSE